MFRRSVLIAALLLGGACASPEKTPSEAAPTAVRGEPIVAFMDIGGVT